MGMIWKWLSRGALGIAAMTLQVGAVAAEETTPQKGGTAIVVIGSDPGGLNAVLSISSADVLAACMVYEGLVVMSSNDEVLPGLAESWTVSEDGKTYTFKLREAQFHDGTPFTSEDVRYTLTEVAAKMSPAVSATLGVNLEAVETPDARTAIIRLKEPYGPLLRSLTCSLSGGILPAHLYKDTDIRNNPVTTTSPVGTGPFKLTRWAKADHLAFERNENYWDPERPYLDGLILKVLPSAGSRVQALLAGEVDFVSSSQFPTSDVKVVEANPNLKLERTGWSPNMLWAFFNLNREPLNDVRVRHALLRATDRDYIFEHAFSSLGRPASAPWTVRIPWATDPAIDYDKSHPFDPEEAGRLLEEAGYKADANGVRFSLTVNYSGPVPERNLAATALQAMWRRAGVDLRVQPLENAVLLPKVHNDADFDVYIASYNSYGDPALGVGPAFVQSMIGVLYGNASHYKNPQVDELFDKAAKFVKIEDRGAAYREIQHIIMQDLPNITLHENHGFDAATKTLHGAWGTYGFGQWGNAWLEQ